MIISKPLRLSFLLAQMTKYLVFAYNSHVLQVHDIIQAAGGRVDAIYSDRIFAEMVKELAFMIVKLPYVISVERTD